MDQRGYSQRYARQRSDKKVRMPPNGMILPLLDRTWIGIHRLAHRDKQELDPLLQLHISTEHIDPYRAFSDSLPS